MGQVIRPGTSRSGSSSYGRRSFFVSHLIRQYGFFRAISALLVAAVIGFLPLAVLIWFNVFRLTSVVSVQCATSVIVKPERSERESEEDEPGETALLQIKCEVPTLDGWRELLRYDDPAQPSTGFNSIHVRHECVYLRKAGNSKLPFGFLGHPPISVWVPAGEYEIAVVHEAPPDRSSYDSPRTGFPFVTTIDSCSVEAQQKTVKRIRLPHYDQGNGTPIALVGQTAENRESPKPNLDPFVDSLRELVAIPTPAGYVLMLQEPHVHHTEDHQGCTVDFEDLELLPREWTRNQLATLRNWLPRSETAGRDRLSPLVSALLRREMFEGWFFYALAGVSGLVLTKWGSLAILEPYRRREHILGSFKLCVFIFFVSAVGWWFVANS